MRAAITAVGGYVPDKIVTNKDLEKLVDTTDEWIQSRTGIKERRKMEDGTATSDICVAAINQIIAKKNLNPQDIDLIIVATVTPDHVFPATANIVAHKIGAINAWGYDVSAACSGFLFALETGSKFIECGKHKKVIVCGADKMSAIVNYQDRNTCVIFGDGGGAVLLEPSEDENGIIDSVLKSDGSGQEFLHQKAGGSLHPPTHETIDARMHYVHQEGKTVFKFAVTNMAEVSRQIMDRNNLTGDSVDYLCAHQANLRIIDATAKRMELDDSKVLINIEKYGNTTAGTIPLLFSDFETKFKKGDNIVLAAFGGGFTWGSIYLKWAYNS
ncbi:MAG TPA: 3-oxoacyl-ACP synthase [Flavobacteriaceae bacterium]|jgi:3-oxoacyl-[acyl-carrier-protein] synthase III|nr:3-oxoacyl-ACP synthase [Flavobacteriaceae bacterium]|tara:strand:+ start:393 stop:1376 length:984 start_codon:yes stop_codon:yes gene_type:complete